MTSMFPRRTALRGAAGAAFGLAAAGAVAGCTEDAPGESSTVPGSTAPRVPVRHEIALFDDGRAVALDPATEPSVAASSALLARATAVVVSGAGDGDVRAGVGIASTLGLPHLVAGPGLPDELDRLGVRTVVRVAGVADAATDGPTPSTTTSRSATPSPVPSDLGDREVVDAPRTGVPEIAGLPADGPTGEVLALLAADTDVPPQVEALLTLCDAGRHRMTEEDPRTDSAVWEPLRAAPEALVVGVGGLGDHFTQRVRTVRRAPEVPGGGYLPFPARRMVALYGHPQTKDLGMLGEQGREASVRRAQAYAQEYERLTGDPVVPAFELIATVAAASAGDDGKYSRRTPVSILRPWVQTAKKAGVYVVLDLQPGRSDFLDQAKAYESLLREPHVGLALDPEWRLGPSEKPLQQIGHVDVDEVNRVGRWLADLVREHDLPPKVLTLHQFRTSMIRGRADLDTGLDEVQWLVHADGQGGQGAKRSTWDALRQDLPDGVFLGWKNFEDEDLPMLTPAETVARVKPTPFFISYQ